MAAEKREVALADHQPSVFRRSRMLGQEAAGPLEPSRCNGEVAAKSEVVPDEPCRDPRRADDIAVIAIEREGALPRAERQRRIVEPPRGESEMLKGLSAFALGEQELELSARFTPGTSIEGGPDQVQSGSHAPSIMDVHPSRPCVIL